MSVTQETDVADSIVEPDDADEVADNALRTMSHPAGV